MIKLVHGVGVNDAEYVVTKTSTTYLADGKRIQKKRVIGFSCCCRQSAALNHIGISFGFACCYTRASTLVFEVLDERNNQSMR